MTKWLCLIFLQIILSESNAQNISISTFNVTGNSSTINANYGLTYSVGESLSIANFLATNNTVLNSGFLQVYQPVVTGIQDTELIGQNIVTALPNPTVNFLNIKANFNKIGQFQFQVIDASSKILLSSNPINTIGAIEKTITLAIYPEGVYYLRVIFRPSTGKTQLGTYKIVKI